jgi:hypothetical protein
MKQLVHISKTGSGIYGLFTNSFLVIPIDRHQLPADKEAADKMVKMRLGDRFQLSNNWNMLPKEEQS